MADVSIKYKGSALAELSDSGSKILKTSGKYCEDNITVEYTKPQVESGDGAEPNSKVFTTDVATKVSGNWSNLVEADADIAAHRNDATFGIAWNCLTAVSAAISTRSGIYTNAIMSLEASDGSTENHGYYMRTNSTGVGACAKLQNLPTAETKAAGACYVREDGSIDVFSSSSYPILAGTYQIIVWW